jgi:hypothetical protein
MLDETERLPPLPTDDDTRLSASSTSKEDGNAMVIVFVLEVLRRDNIEQNVLNSEMMKHWRISALARRQLGRPLK